MGSHPVYPLVSKMLDKAFERLSIVFIAVELITGIQRLLEAKSILS